MKKGDVFEIDVTVSQEIYEGFIRLFNDNHPLHTNDSYAKNAGFEGVVMHGAILVGFLSYLVGVCLPLKDVLVHSYQTDFMLPVYMGDQLKLKAEVADHFESVGTYEIKYKFRNSKSKAVAKGTITVGKLNKS